MSPRSGLGRVYARWRGSFLRSLTRTRGVDSPAEDVLHDAVIQCMSSQASLANDDETRAYLHRIALNNMLAEARERAAGRVLQTVPVDDVDDTAKALSAPRGTDPMQMAGHRQRIARLREALDELPGRQQEAFVLHRFDGLTQDEVATRMGISRRMVVKHVARALAYCEVRVLYVSAEQMRQHHPATVRTDDDDAGAATVADERD